MAWPSARPLYFSGLRWLAARRRAGWAGFHGLLAAAIAAAACSRVRTSTAILPAIWGCRRGERAAALPGATDVTDLVAMDGSNRAAGAFDTDDLGVLKAVLSSVSRRWRPGGVARGRHADDCQSRAIGQHLAERGSGAFLNKDKIRVTPTTARSGDHRGRFLRAAGTGHGPRPDLRTGS